MYELADMFGGYNLVACFELFYRKVGADYSHGRCTTQHCGASVDWPLGVAMILAYYSSRRTQTCLKTSG